MFFTTPPPKKKTVWSTCMQHACSTFGMILLFMYRVCKFSCEVDLLFYWFGFNQTNKSVDNVNLTKLLNPNQLHSKRVFSGNNLSKIWTNLGNLSSLACRLAAIMFLFIERFALISCDIFVFSIFIATSPSRKHYYESFLILGALLPNIA